VARDAVSVNPGRRRAGIAGRNGDQRGIRNQKPLLCPDSRNQLRTGDEKHRHTAVVA
jgi:hypothetical protein